MSFLMAAGAIAHLERNGDIVLTGYGKAIVFFFAVIIWLCMLLVVVVAEGKSAR